MTSQPELGATAPGFELADQNGDLVTLDSFRGHQVFVYFYPRADTPGCTTQACSLRDAKASIGSASVIGISPDKAASLLRFDSKYSLGFTLLSDPNHTIAQAYGAWGEKKMYGKVTQGVIRSAVLLDPAGIVIARWPKLSPKDTVASLLAALELES